MRNRTELIENLQKVLVMRKMHGREQQAIAIMKLDELTMQERIAFNFGMIY